VLEKVGALSVQLSDRRVFAQITQGSPSGEVKLYERQKDGTFTVTIWSTGQSFTFLDDVYRSMFGNKGGNCIGKQVIAVLHEKLGVGKVSEGVAAPVSPAAAFRHSIKDASGEFIRSVIVILS
jgi:hypothetical protein